MDTTEQLKFIVDFANRNMKNQREGDWINLQDDIRRFFPSEGIARPGVFLYDPRTDPELEKYPKPKIVILQEHLKGLLNTKTKLESMSMVNINVDIHYLPVLGGLRNVTGNVRDVFLHYVLTLLNDRASSKIRQCSCGRFFFRVRRQVHCSPQCADKANYEDRQKKSLKKRKKKPKRRFKK
jgi:hypothetical protein